MPYALIIPLIPLLPLLAFVVLGLGGHVIKERAHWIAVPAVVGSFLLSLMALSEVASGAVLRIPLYTWANSGDLTITLGLLVDQLTVAMLMLDHCEFPRPCLHHWVYAWGAGLCSVF